MWNAALQEELDQLQSAQALTKLEQSRLSELTEQRLRHDDQRLLEEARRREERNAAVAARIRQVEEQNHALQELVREQEAYLSEVRQLIRQIEARRESWRERYSTLTGRDLGSTATVPDQR